MTEVFGGGGRGLAWGGIAGTSFDGGGRRGLAGGGVASLIGADSSSDNDFALDGGGGRGLAGGGVASLIEAGSSSDNDFALDGGGGRGLAGGGVASLTSCLTVSVEVIGGCGLSSSSVTGGLSILLLGAMGGFLGGGGRGLAVTEGASSCFDSVSAVRSVSTGGVVDSSPSVGVVLSSSTFPLLRIFLGRGLGFIGGGALTSPLLSCLGTGLGGCGLGGGAVLSFSLVSSPLLVLGGGTLDCEVGVVLSSPSFLSGAEGAVFGAGGLGREVGGILESSSVFSDDRDVTFGGGGLGREVGGDLSPPSGLSAPSVALGRGGLGRAVGMALSPIASSFPASRRGGGGRGLELGGLEGGDLFTCFGDVFVSDSFG